MKKNVPDSPVYARLLSAFAAARPQARTSATQVSLWCGVPDYKLRRVRLGEGHLTMEELLTIQARTGLSVTWIRTGQDPMHATPHAMEARVALPALPPSGPAVTRPPQTVPLLGFASCGVRGWHGRMTYAMAATAPQARPDMVAVMAMGDSLLPAGIGNGHICFCDPHAQPIPGEVVYVEHSADELCTLKEYVGQGEDALQDAAPDELVLRGWLPPESIPKDGSPAPQKPFYLRIPSRFIRLLAPVIYVQRRL